MDRLQQEERNRTTHELTEERSGTAGPFLVCAKCGAVEAELWSLSCEEKAALADQAPTAAVLECDVEVAAWRARLSALVELQGTALNDADRREVDDAVAQVEARIAHLLESGARDELATLEHGNDLTPGAVLINADTDKRRSELATLMLNAEHTARATLTLVREGRAT